MSLRSSLAVTRKELLASLRDRQTALYTFVLPLVMYPAVCWLMVQGFLVVQGTRERTEVTIGLAGAAPVEMHDELARVLDTAPEDPDEPAAELDGSLMPAQPRCGLSAWPEERAGRPSLCG